MDQSTPHAVKLQKALGAWDVFSLAAGAMISSGLFVLPGIVFGKIGPAMMLAYLAAGLLYLPAMIAKAELASALPRAGGTYFFVERSFGPLMGTLAGLGNWLSLALKTAFAFVGIGTLAAFAVGSADPWIIKGVALAACLGFAALNLFSVKGTGRLQCYLVLLLIGLLLVYCLCGMIVVEPTHYRPFFVEGAGFWTFLTVTGMVFVSYGGLTKVVDIAEEVQHPQRNVPLGMFLAFAVVNGLYVVVAFVTVGVVAPTQLAGSYVPIALGAGEILGVPGRICMSVAALLAYATTGNAGILSASRSPMAMGRDGLLPAGLGRTNERFGTPHVAIGLTASLMALVIALLSIETLVKAASAIMLLCFLLLTLCVFVLRQSGIQGYRPTIRVPFYPWLPGAGILVYLILIVTLGWIPLLLTVGIGMLAFLWYLFYVPRNIERRPAVIQFVRRVLALHFQRSGLDQEMLEIKLERDDVMLDRFDRLVQTCPVLDLEEPLEEGEFFRVIAKGVAADLKMSVSELEQALRDREEENSTVIQPGLAIPHVIVPGTRVFAMVVVRCADGITFEAAEEPITTAFVLFGSADERQFHLQALMAVANIVCEKGFHERWRAAAGAEQLRDVLLLSERQRMSS